MAHFPGSHRIAAPTFSATSEHTMISSPQLDGSVYIAVWPPQECRCGYMAAMLVNRDGKTRCMECDREYRGKFNKN